MTFYRERLSPSWWMVAAVGLVFPATVLIFLPLSILVGVVAGALLWGGSVGLLWISSPVVRVNNGTLSVGSAHLEERYIGSVDVFAGDEARHEKGPGAHGLTWFCLRPWIDPIVKVSVNDPEDPTPYWLVSTRRPEALTQALGKN
jgi:hypothetical protein